MKLHPVFQESALRKHRGKVSFILLASTLANRSLCLKTRRSKPPKETPNGEGRSGFFLSKFRASFSQKKLTNTDKAKYGISQ